MRLSCVEAHVGNVEEVVLTIEHSGASNLALGGTIHRGSGRDAGLSRGEVDRELAKRGEAQLKRPTLERVNGCSREFFERLPPPNCTSYFTSTSITAPTGCVMPNPVARLFCHG
jgi:hypothetical protein